MNQKKAKALRKQSRAQTVGHGRTTYVTDRKTGSAIVSPWYTRGVYRSLKGAARTAAQAIRT